MMRWQDLSGLTVQGRCNGDKPACTLLYIIDIMRIFVYWLYTQESHYIAVSSQIALYLTFSPDNDICGA